MPVNPDDVVLLAEDVLAEIEAAHRDAQTEVEKAQLAAEHEMVTGIYELAQHLAAEARKYAGLDGYARALARRLAPSSVHTGGAPARLAHERKMAGAAMVERWGLGHLLKPRG
jgi:hypothetical protein